MATIPSWLMAIIKLAVQIGSPYLLELVKKWFSKLPVEVVEIINELINGIKNPAIPTRNAKKAAAFKLKRCQGVACAPEVKKD